jgi:hypothetical protein
MEGPEAVAAYLKKMGIRAIIACNFDSALSLYNRRFYRDALTHPESSTLVDRLIAPKNLKFMDDIDELARMAGDKNVLRHGPLRVIVLK